MREIASVCRYSTAVASSLTKRAERGVLALERPRDESREAAGLLLQIADQFQVVHALLDGLAAAEHHGGGGAHAELVGGAVHVHPFLRASTSSG